MGSFGLASDPTQKATAAVHSDQKNSWNQLRETAKRLLKPTSIQEDSSTRILFKYGASGAHYYEARPFSGFNCVAQVDVGDPSAAAKLDAVAKQIVESLSKTR